MTKSIEMPRAKNTEKDMEPQMDTDGHRLRKDNVVAKAQRAKDHQNHNTCSSLDRNAAMILFRDKQLLKSRNVEYFSCWVSSDPFLPCSIRCMETQMKRRFLTEHTDSMEKNVSVCRFSLRCT